MPYWIIYWDIYIWFDCFETTEYLMLLWIFGGKNVFKTLIFNVWNAERGCWRYAWNIVSSYFYIDKQYFFQIINESSYWKFPNFYLLLLWNEAMKEVKRLGHSSLKMWWNNLVINKHTECTFNIPEEYLQSSGALGTAGSGGRDTQTSLLGQSRTVYYAFCCAVRTTVMPNEPGRRTRSRVVDTHWFRKGRALGRISVAVHATYASRRVASHL